MNFAIFSNIVAILVGCGVLAQSVRLMRAFRAVKDGGLAATVAALQKATAEAHAVLADLKDTLRTEGAANARALAQGQAVRDELAVIAGIADAAAERVIGSIGSKGGSTGGASAPRSARQVRTRPSSTKAKAGGAR